MHLQYPVLQIPRPFRDRIRSRVTRFYGNYQSCMPFYKDFYKCAYEVGQPVEHEECWKEFRDMRECENMWKTVRHFHLTFVLSTVACCKMSLQNGHRTHSFLGECPSHKISE